MTAAFAPPRGRQPSIEWVPSVILLIDDSYQRSAVFAYTGNPSDLAYARRVLRNACTAHAAAIAATGRTYA